MKRSFIREILENINPDTISFAGGLPDSTLFPYEKLQKCAYEALGDANNLQYGRSSGVEELREIIAGLYTENGIYTTPKNILITSGSQQALDIISRFYKDKEITVESPSYLGALNIFKLNNLKPNRVRITEDGIDLDCFKESINRTKLAYLIPDFQNPSSVQYTLKQREEIAKICKEEGAILIEDAPYSDLYFEEKLESISSLLPNSSFHLGSFSKVLSPALRIGYIRADDKLIEPLVAYKEIMDLHTSSISQYILLNFLKDKNSYSKHLDNLRDSYREKMEFFALSLDRYLPSFNYSKPNGGMFIYGSFKDIDSTKLLKDSIEQGVVFVPGIEFKGSFNEIRFNFTNSSKDDILKGIKRLAKLVN